MPPSERAMLPTNMLGSFLMCWGMSMPGFAVPFE